MSNPMSLSIQNSDSLLPRPKIVRVEYEKERKEFYHLPQNPTLKTFNSYHVFGSPDLRMAYLRDLNNFIESNIQNFNKKDINDLSILSRKLWLYLIAGKNRRYLSQNHLCSIWILRCRMDFIVHTLSSNEEIKLDLGNVERFPILSQFDIIISDEDIYHYKINDLIIALELIAERLPEIKLFDEIPGYIRCLYISCAKYFIAYTTDEEYYDIEKYKTSYVNKGKTFYGISMEFIRDTERIFYDIERRIWMKNQFSYYPEEFLSGSDMIQLDLLSKKLCEEVKPATQFLEPIIQKHIFQFMVAPGEKEKFIENNRIKKPEPFNIISFSRPEKSKMVISMFEGDFFAPVYKTLSKFVVYRNKDKKEEQVNQNEEKESRDEDEISRRLRIMKEGENKNGPKKAYEVDYMFELTCMVMCNFIYHNSVKSKTNFEKFVILYENITLPIEENNFYANRLPYIIQVFSNWGVWDPEIRKIHHGKTFLDCFLIWLKLLDKNPFKQREVELMKKNGLEQLLASITPVRKSEFQLFKNFLPSNYTEDDMGIEF